MDSNQKQYGDEKHRQWDDAEKGVYEHEENVLVRPPFVHLHETLSSSSTLSGTLSPLSPIHEGITPSSSVPVLTLARPAISPRLSKDFSTSLLPVEKLETIPAPKPKTQPPKKKVSRWILFRLWFNTYRMLFTFVTTLNLVGLIMCALGYFPYAEDHIGYLVLGNLLMAVMMRNELFLRFLYLVAIYGLRGVSCFGPFLEQHNTDSSTVGPCFHETLGNFVLAAHRRYSFWLCAFWCSVSSLSREKLDHSC